ncbi:MAG: hypothetical protein ACR2KK_13885 [Acidimicrobiales bacterium]
MNPDLDATLADHMAALRSHLDVALAAGIEQVRAEALAVVESSFATALADDDETLARLEALELDASARLSGLERHVGPELRRLSDAIEALPTQPSTSTALESSVDALAARLAGLEEDVRTGLARLAEVPRDRDALDAQVSAAVDERLAAVDPPDQPELLRLAQAVEDLQRWSATAADLDRLRAEVEAAVDERVVRVQAEPAAETLATDDLATLRTELRDGLAEELAALRSVTLEAADARIAAAGTDLQEQLDALAVEVSEAAAPDPSVEAALARIGAIDEHVNQELARLSEAVAASRNELAVKVADLETNLRRWAADWRAEITGRPSASAREMALPPADLGRRLGGKRKRKIRKAEVERLVQSVEEWRTQSVGEEEFVALRRDLETLLARQVASSQAEVQRRFAVLDAVVANNADDEADEATALLDNDVRGLQVEVRELTEIVAELQERITTSRRKPASKATPAPVESVPAGRARTRSKGPKETSDEAPAEAEPPAKRPATGGTRTTEAARTARRKPQNPG